MMLLLCVCTSVQGGGRDTTQSSSAVRPSSAQKGNSSLKNNDAASVCAGVQGGGRDTKLSNSAMQPLSATKFHSEKQGCCCLYMCRCARWWQRHSTEQLCCAALKCTEIPAGKTMKKSNAVASVCVQVCKVAETQHRAALPCGLLVHASTASTACPPTSHVTIA